MGLCLIIWFLQESEPRARRKGLINSTYTRTPSKRKERVAHTRLHTHTLSHTCYKIQGEKSDKVYRGVNMVNATTNIIISNSFSRFLCPHPHYLVLHSPVLLFLSFPCGDGKVEAGQTCTHFSNRMDAKYFLSQKLYLSHVRNATFLNKFVFRRFICSSRVSPVFKLFKILGSCGIFIVCLF